LALGSVALVALLMPLLQWRQLSSEALRQLLRAEMTRVSDSMYVLQISPVHLRFLPGAISFDSAYVTTDTIRRAAAFPNRPELRIGVHDCQLSGVNVWKLLRKQGLYGSLFRCSDVRIGAQVATTDSPAGPTRSKREGGLDFLRLRRELRLPAELPVIKVENVEFPAIRLDLTRQRPDLPAERVALQKFSARFEDVVVDPQLPLAERRPLFARQIALAAEELAIGSGDQTVSFKRMAADLDEGSFTLIGLRVTPSDTASAWFRRQKFRRPWVQLVADSVRFAGIDLAQLIMDGKVVTQRIVIGGLDATIETDASLPPRPPSAAATVSPVQEAAAVAATGVRLEADTVELIDGTTRYTGHRPGRPTTSVWLPHFAFQARDILIDPALPPSQQRPLLARVAELNLDGATYTTGDSLKSMTLGQLRLRVGDSVLVARQLTVGPALSDASWMKRQTVRRTLGRARVDSVVLRGVNYDDLIVRSTLLAREMTVSGVRVRLQKDMTLPAPPTHAERSSPALDSTLADIGVPTHIERLHADGDVTYIEHHRGLPDREFTVRRVAVSGDRLAVGTAKDVRVPFLAQRLTLVLTGIDRRWGKVRSLAVGTVRANFGDSTLSIDSIRIAPHYTRTPQRTGVRVALDSMRFSGVDFVRLADGRGASIQRAIFGNASVDVKVDGGVVDSRLPADSRLPTADSSFTGLSFPIAIRDLQVLRGRGLYTKTELGKAPLVLSLGTVTVAGRSLALQRGVTRPLLEQDLVVRVSNLDVSGDPAHGHAASAAISLGDSSIALKGIRIRTGSARDSVPTGTRGGNGVVLSVDSVRLGGIHFGELARGKAVRLGRVAVGTVDAEVQHVAGPKDSSATAHADREAGQADGLPVAVADLHIPIVHFRYVDTRADGKRHVVSVRKASLSAEDLSLNPGASRESRLRHISRHAHITADGIVIDDDPLNSFTVRSLAASLGDSAVQVRGVYIGPTVSDSVWVSHQAHRRDRIRVEADSVFLAGFDLDRLVLGDGLWVRHQRVYGLDIDAYTDKNLKPEPVSTKHSSAQQDVQSIKFPFGVDTISVIDGLVAYHELDVGKPQAGTMTFSDITATVTGLTSRGVAGKSPPLRIATHSTIFGAGKLDAWAEAPLTSSGFDVVYHGRLGPMPAVAVNQFAEKALPVTIEGGQVEEVTFSVGSKNGHAVGNIVPIYHGLKVKLHDSKASLFKRIEYSVLTFVAKEFFIRHDNPGKTGQPPRVGVIDHTFQGESIVQFLWYAVRGGIEKSILK
jgi:hypothetical protein